MSNSKLKFLASCSLLVFTPLLSTPCFAGGGEYELADDTEDAGPAYFGFVRDERGLNIAGAKAVLTSKSGVKVELKTNILGVYRSHVAKNIKPEDITLTCQKDGYTQLKIVSRPNSSNRYVENDCILKKGN
jgi:hypothetical protein